jgi:hypothetical protein
MAHPFGTEAYAREELRAEIASLILGSELGIGYDPEQHAGYVDHWIQILTETPKEILYAAADAERISEYILTIEQRQEIHQRREATNVKRDISEAERIYLAVPYEEREEAKALGARWDGTKKAWYVGPEVDRTKITKWELRHQPEPILDPRAEFAEVRLSEDLRGLSSGVETMGYHKAKQIEAIVGAPVRNGDVLVPGYDSDGKLWTVQYIKEDGTKRFAKESRKHGCFHVIGAANGAAALQKISLSPVVVIAEGYATAATIAKNANVTAIAAFDSGNLSAVATALRERHKDKPIIIAGDDDHRRKGPGTNYNYEAEKVIVPNPTFK